MKRADLEVFPQNLPTCSKQSLGTCSVVYLSWAQRSFSQSYKNMLEPENLLTVPPDAGHCRLG